MWNLSSFTRGFVSSFGLYSTIRNPNCHKAYWPSTDVVFLTREVPLPVGPTRVLRNWKDYSTVPAAPTVDSPFRPQPGVDRYGLRTPGTFREVLSGTDTSESGHESSSNSQLVLLATWHPWKPRALYVSDTGAGSHCRLPQKPSEPTPPLRSVRYGPTKTRGTVFEVDPRAS